MTSISETIARYQSFSAGFGSVAAAGDPSKLVALDAFGRNPGNLKALIYVPADLKADAPLVVVLHGCTQTASAYDRGSGWSALADRFGFAALFPEQQRANNPNLCFNWFAPTDTRRGDGEVESIREMIATVVDQHRLDPARVFVTGLSAGGAMTSAMLAAHPELFAGGAIIAGLPHGAAANVSQALERMRGQGYDRATLSEHIRAASSHRGTWPAISVWHGTADRTVDAINASLIVDQWRGIHGIEAAPTVDAVDGQRHLSWHDSSGRRVIEEFSIAGLGHGTPIATSGDEAYGIPGPHMLDAGISSTYRIAASWGIVPTKAPASRQLTACAVGADRSAAVSTASSAFDPGQVIDRALRAAGLIRS